MSKSLRVVFMGTPAFAVSGLRSIVESQHEVVGIVTAPDRPAGRGKKMRFSAIKDVALEYNIPLYQPEKLSSLETVTQLDALNADVFVVVAFRMLPKVIWELPKLGTFNLHASLLPQYRGAAPIHWSIINGEQASGLTTFLIDDKIDTGAILLQKKLDILPEDTMGILSERMQNHAGELIIATLDGLALGTLKPIPQEETETIKAAPKLKRENTQIDWCQPGQHIVQFIRGLNPFPTAWTLMENNAETIQVKIHDAHFVSETPKEKPGHITVKNKELYVSVADGYIYINKLQLPNKKSMETRALLNGFLFSATARFIS
jgi:methionyl-tRNA formyltransferase